ncbi:MAG TPA: radical SAM protein [Oligoflexus sp.]|uniref:radical SAM protein n=1 Tax=Oligoflexus sp. TaxID=1971216 RepID=UPI002D3E90B6|nr:radical SAM protein [Oligoflexus sp.]HYX33267.1 radical SAM protein [Oligoflexus sp.]
MQEKPFIAHQIILKIASRCNLFCNYCHWFRDKEVFKEPKIFSEEIEDLFVMRLRRYLEKYEIKELSLVFHGGEPLLFPMKRYDAFIKKVDKVEAEMDVKLHLSMTTNATLMTDEWARFLLERRISPGISLDGTEAMHNANRVDRFGRGSHAKVVEGIQRLREYGFEPGVLTVANLDHDPAELCDYFVNELQITDFDVLIPNFTRDDAQKNLVRSIADYYIKLFDLWYDIYSDRGVKIRYLESLSKVVLGVPGSMQGMGGATLATLEVLPSGSIEPHDVLRIGGNQNVNTNLNVRTHDFDEVFQNQVWMSAFQAAKNPCASCLDCNYLAACGGGDVMHRYSQSNGYDNPSVYCQDLQRIYQHAFDRIVADLRLEVANQ